MQSKTATINGFQTYALIQETRCAKKISLAKGGELLADRKTE